MTYELAGTASPSEAAEVLDLARQLDAQVRKWMREQHPDLL